MKLKFLLFLLIPAILIIIHENSSGKKPLKKSIEPVLIDSANYIYEAGNIYLAGQPSKENFTDLKKMGLSLVINIRTDEEVEENNAGNYNEEEFLESLGIGYFHISVGGSGGNNPLVVDKIAEIIKGANGKVMIHCRSAVRATLVWMAWLVRYQNYSVNEVVRLGKMARYSYPFEEILGLSIKMKVTR